MDLFSFLGGTGGSPTPGHSQAGQQPTAGGGGGDSPTHVKNLSVNIPLKSEPVKSTSVGQVGLPQLPHSPYRGPGSTYMQLQQQPIYGGGQTFMQQQQHYHVSPQRLVQSILHKKALWMVSESKYWIFEGYVGIHLAAFLRVFFRVSAYCSNGIQY